MFQCVNIIQRPQGVHGCQYIGYSSRTWVGRSCYNRSFGKIKLSKKYEHTWERVRLLDPTHLTLAGMWLLWIERLPQVLANTGTVKDVAFASLDIAYVD